MDKGPSCPAVHWFGAAAGTPPGDKPGVGMARASNCPLASEPRLVGIEVMPRHMMTDVKIPGLEFTDLQRRLSRRCGTRRQTGVSRQTVVSPELALASLASFPRESDNQADLDSRSSA